METEGECEQIPNRQDLGIELHSKKGFTNQQVNVGKYAIHTWILCGINWIHKSTGKWLGKYRPVPYMDPLRGIKLDPEISRLKFWDSFSQLPLDGID